MHEMSTKEQIKLIVSFLLGIGITILAFLAFIIMLFIAMPVLLIFVFIFYISIIIFLFLWNKSKSKQKYIPLGIAAICVLIAGTIMGYTYYLSNIPSVTEPDNSYLYEPFSGKSNLALLDRESNYKIVDNPPVLDGATALYPVYAAFVTAVYPEANYDPYNSIVLCSKTIDAYNNLLQGDADIIFCAGPSDEQMRQFLESGIKINLVPIGREAFVFFVNKRNRISNVSVENIQGIYSGKIKNWNELGGFNKRIKVYQRPANSGSQTALEKIMGDIPIMEPVTEDVADFMGSMITRVASYRNFDNAIGYSFLHFTIDMARNDQIKLSVNQQHFSVKGNYSG